MGINDGDHCRNQEPELPFMPELFGQEQQNSDSEEDIRAGFMMMSFVSVPERICSDNKSEEYHKILKSFIINDISSKNGKTREN
jgi:hypothetical protein